MAGTFGCPLGGSGADVAVRQEVEWAHSRARARLNWVFQGQCWGRCKVRRRYDPETDEFHARIVDSSEPVVTRWDDSPPEQTERPVGTFDVTPTEAEYRLTRPAGPWCRRV